MSDTLRQEWEKFLNGHWTKDKPTYPGQYHTADRMGFHANQIVIYRGDNGQIFQASEGSTSANPIPWGGWFWSIPTPPMPAPPIWE